MSSFSRMQLGINDMADRAERPALIDRTTRTAGSSRDRVMAQSTIDRLIVNSPYEEPACYWGYDRTTYLSDLAQDTALPDTWLPPRRPAPSTPPASSLKSCWSITSAEGQGVARSRLARGLRGHPAPAPILERPGGVRVPALLLLPARSSRNAGLADRGARDVVEVKGWIE